MKGATVDRWRRGSLLVALTGLAALVWLTWLPSPWGAAPAWFDSPDVTAPLTRKLVFYHPPSAWASFAAYLVVFAASIAYLNERRLRDDATAQAAAEAGFLMNTIALATGTLWGVQEWYKDGQQALATVYTDPKVLVVLVLWLTFAAYLLLRRLVDGAERRARLCAAFGILGFLGVPASYLVGRVVATDLHPDEPAFSAYQGAILLVGSVAFTALFVHLFLARLRQLRLKSRITALEAAWSPTT